jgi:hypothetical protein
VFAACCVSLVFGACGSDAPAPAADAGSGGGPTLIVENPGSGSAGRPAAIGGGGSSAPNTTSAGASAAGSGGTLASAGSPAAGAGGSVAGDGGALSAGAGGAGGAGGDDDDDVFGGLFPTPQVSCDGLICLEDADCASLYPDEDAACHFTHCEDLVCK